MNFVETSSKEEFVLKKKVHIELESSRVGKVAYLHHQ